MKKLDGLPQLREIPGRDKQATRCSRSVEKPWVRLGAEAVNDTVDQLRKLNSSFVFGRTRITFIT